MRKQFFIWSLCFGVGFWGFGVSGNAQTTASVDTTIYSVLEMPARFPACEKLDTTLEFKKQCAQAALLNFVYRNMEYPYDARLNEVEGSVVVRFVVETDGTLSQFAVMKDIGSGCGIEALRLAQLMNTLNIRWVPGQKDGKTVRSQVVLPVKFSLANTSPFVLLEGDTIYTVLHKTASFKGGQPALDAYLSEKLIYPAEGLDSCKIGEMTMQLLVKPNGEVKVLDMDDPVNLGSSYWWEASKAINGSYHRWEPGVFKDKPVPSAIETTVTFLPGSAKCKPQVEAYKKASILADDGANMFNSGKQEEGIVKLSEALLLMPEYIPFLYLRGQAFMELKQYEKACVDFTKAKSISGIGLYDSIMPIICK